MPMRKDHATLHGVDAFLSKQRTTSITQEFEVIVSQVCFDAPYHVDKTL